MRKIKGSALITVMMIVIVLLLLASGVIAVTSGSASITASINTDKTNFWEAESGINIGLKRLKNLTVSDFQKNQPYSSSEDYTINNNIVTVKVEKVNVNDLNKSESWQITSTTKHGSEILKSIRLRNLTPVSPGFYTTFMKENMDTKDWTRFSSNDAFYGPTHFQGLLKIVGNPGFYGEVTSSSDMFSRGVIGDAWSNLPNWNDYSIIYDDGTGAKSTLLKNIFSNTKYVNKFGNGIWDTSDNANGNKIKNQTEMDNKYFGDPNNPNDKGLFKVSYDHVDSKDVPSMFDDFTTITSDPKTLKLNLVEGVTSSDIIRIKFLSNKNECQIQRRKNGQWKKVGNNISLNNYTAISIPESFDNNLYVKGEYQESISIVTEKANIIVDGDLYPKGLSTTNTNITTLQNSLKNIDQTLALMAGMKGLQDPKAFEGNSTVGNIFIGQSTSESNSDIVIAAGLFAYGDYGVARKDIGANGGYDANTTGFGSKFDKTVNVRLLGNIMMAKKGLFSHGAKGINTKFIFDPRANEFLLPPHLRPVVSANGEFSINDANAIWEIL